MNKTFGLSRMTRVAGIAGVVLLLAGCAAQTPAPVRSMPQEPEDARPGGLQADHHIVQPGDTLMGISRSYGYPVSDLVAWNDIANPNQLYVGQRLRVAPPEGESSSVAVAQPVQIDADGTGGEDVPVVDAPRGGSEPYSEQAWAEADPEGRASEQEADDADAPAVVTDQAWLWPAQGELLSEFDESSSKGVDIAGQPGDAVIAAAGGSVVYSGSGLRGYGKLVIIKHDDDYLTAYAHNQSLLVQEGDSVTQGQQIAELGSTDADRPKLHFEIRRQGRPVDPLQYLPAR